MVRQVYLVRVVTQVSLDKARLVTRAYRDIQAPLVTQELAAHQAQAAFLVTVEHQEYLEYREHLVHREFLYPQQLLMQIKLLSLVLVQH